MKRPILILATIVGSAACGAAEIPAPPSGDDAQRQEDARAQEAMRDEGAQEVSAQRQGSFVFKAVDQLGKPIAAIPIDVTVATVNPAGPDADPHLVSRDLTKITDEKGEARVDVASFLMVSADIRWPAPQGFLPMHARGSASWGIDARDAKDMKKGAVVDHTFTLYRMEGPEPLTLWDVSLEHPGDGSALAWNLFGERIGATVPYGPDQSWTGPAQLAVRVWRDPAAEGVRRAPPWGLPEAPWWIELACVDGGLAEAGEGLSFKAPATGYEKKLRWTFTPGTPGYADHQQVRVFWQRPGTPTRYGLLSLAVGWKAKPLRYTVKGFVLYNPSGGVLFERPVDVMNAFDADHAGWLSRITPEQRATWALSGSGDPKKP